MGVTIRQAATGFGVSHQTVRNWIKHPLMNQYFSPSARREGGREYAELFNADLEVCNSIHSMIRDNKSWEEISEKLATGWRDKDLPARALLTLPPGAVETTAYTLMARASAEQKSTDLIVLIQEKDKRIAELEAKIDRKDEEHKIERDDLKRQLEKERVERAATVSRLELEVEMWRSGRLTQAAAQPADGGEGSE